jgi:hypothetical protein
MPTRKSSKLSRRHRNRKARTVKRRKSHSRRLRGGSGGSNGLLMSTPWPGSPYDAAAADLPIGKYLPLSSVGIPSGAMNVPMPSNSQFGGGRRRSKKGKKGGCWPWSKSKKGKKGGKRSGRRSGRRSSKRSRSMRGGGLSAFMSTIFPDDAVNAVRSVPAAFGHLSDKFNGLISSPSSMVYPTQQPFVQQIQDPKIITPPDIKAIYNHAASRVQGI